MTRSIYFFVLFASLISAFLCYYLQNHFFLEGDVGYLLEATQRLLSGGHYVTQIFETNPPLILGLYSPVCLLAQHFALDLTMTLRAYVILLAWLSFCLSLTLLKKLIHAQDNYLFYGLSVTLLFINFLLPVNAFGQREHFLLLLCLPYLLSSALRAQSRDVPSLLAIVIGTLAGLGFALKPHFLLTPILIELFISIKKQSLLNVLQIEPFMIASILLAYFISLLLWEPNYIHILLPLVARYYLPFARQNWQDFFSPPYVTFCLAALFSYPIFYSHDRYRELGCIFFLGGVGLTAAFFIAKTSWYYHVLPALGLAYLLVTHYFAQIMQSQAKLQKILISCMGVAILSVPLYNFFLLLQYNLKATKDHYKQAIIRYINNTPGDHSMVCLPIGTRDCFPLVYLTHGRYASRYPSLWWYKGLKQKEKTGYSAKMALQDKQYLIDNLADDLIHEAARWVLFNNAILDTNTMLAYLAENSKFHTTWQKHYHYLMRMGTYQIYEHNVGISDEFH